MNNKSKNIAILGSGSWGGTIANLLADKGFKPILWTPNLKEYEEIKRTKCLHKPFKYKLHKNISISTDLKKTTENSSIIVIAVPTSAIEELTLKLKKINLKKTIPIISATKGITTNTYETPSKILSKNLKNEIAVLSGPNIAVDVLSKAPIITIIACKNRSTAKYLQNVFSTSMFRVYTNEDVKGIELAGALKNVIAIAAGISDGLGFNISTKAALISRGLIEIAKVVKKEGGKPITLLGAAGIGDLIATCCSPNSRNYRVGFNLAKGKKLNQILKDLGQVAEGVETVRSMVKLSKKYKIDLPIAETVNDILSNKSNTKTAINKLLNRPLITSEFNF